MGEFNINKSDGSLEQTAGMPETYPAEQVMLSDGVTSVEDALDKVSSSLITKTYSLVEPNSTLIDLKLTKSGNTVSLYFRWYGMIPNDGGILGYLPPNEGLDASITMHQICSAVSANSLEFRGHALVAIESGRTIKILALSDWSNVGNSLIVCNMTWEV